MARVSWPYDSTLSVDGNGNPVYSNALSSDYLAMVLQKVLRNGVFMDVATSYQVLANSGMTLTLKVGAANIQGHISLNLSDSTLTIATADSQPRYDRIVLRHDANALNIYPLVIKGTPATSPVAPAQYRTSLVYDITLAYVYVGANATSISQAWITDKRASSECGIVASIIGETDFSTLYAQFTDTFNTWFATAQNTLSGDAAGNLLALINQHVSYTGDDTATDSQRAQARKNTRNYLQTYTDASQIGITLSTTTTLEEIALAMPVGSQLFVVPSGLSTSNISPSYSRYGALTLTKEGSGRIFAIWNPSSSSDVWVASYANGSFFAWKRASSNIQSGIVSITIPSGSQNASGTISFSPAFSVAPNVTPVLSTGFPGGRSCSLDATTIPTTKGFKVNAGLSANAGSDTVVIMRWYAEEVL